MLHDPYAIGAASMTGKAPDQVTAEERRSFKEAMLLALYSAGEQKLLDEVYKDLETKVKDAKH